MKWWKKLKYWQKGGIIGFSIGIILMIIYGIFIFVDPYQDIIPHWIYYIFLPFFIGNYIVGPILSFFCEDMCFGLFELMIIVGAILGTIICGLFGALIGFIIDKYKK